MQPFLKRILDIFLSLLTILILSPVFILIILLLSLTGEHKVLYMQERIGYRNLPFKVFKFVTMLQNSPNIGTGSITLRNDPRVLPIGRFLRKTKINELPQVFNVLIGNMSIVGPRPQMQVDLAKFPGIVRQKLYQYKPGITGIGSIFFRDEESLISKCGEEPHTYYKKVIAPYKGALELWYQDNISLKTDIKIIFLTAWQIIFPQSNLAFRIFKDLPPRPAELLPGKAMTPSELEVAIQEEVVVEE
jgi:lipopolysaccharide/colanic/teichoic acid biosynthesis glycosyltransferase